MSVIVAGKLTNRSGIIQSAGALNLRANEIALTRIQADRRAAILAKGNLTLTTNKLTAGESGLLQSNGGSLILRSPSGAIDITGGIWRAAGQIDVNAGRVALSGGDLGAGGALTVIAGTGNLIFTGTANASSITMKSVKSDVVIDGKLSSSGAIRLEAAVGNLTHSAQVATPDSLILLAADNLTDKGRGLLPAGATAGSTHLGTLAIAGGDVVKAGGHYSIAGAANITSRTGSVSLTGRMISGGTIKATAITGITNTGTLDGANLNISAGQITNRGTVIADDLSFDAKTQGIINSGKITAANTFRLTAPKALVNQSGGEISVHSGVTNIKAADLINAGTIGLFDARLNLTSDLRNSGTLSANTKGTIGGTLVNTGDIKGGNHTLTLANLDNRGTFRTDGRISLTMSGSNIHNSGVLHGDKGVSIANAAVVTNTASGEISGGTLSLIAQRFNNSGNTIAKEWSQITVSGGLINSGTIQNGAAWNAQGQAIDSRITATTISNSGDIIADQGGLILTGNNGFTNTGQISGRGTNSYLTLRANDLTRPSDLGKVAADGTLVLSNTSGGFLNAFTIAQGEEFVTKGALRIKATRFENAGGLAGLGGLTLEGNSLKNTGTVYSENDIALRIRDLVDNDGGLIMALMAD